MRFECIKDLYVTDPLGNPNVRAFTQGKTYTAFQTTISNSIRDFQGRSMWAVIDDLGFEHAIKDKDTESSNPNEFFHRHFKQL